MTGDKLDREFEEFQNARERIRCTMCSFTPELREWAENRYARGASFNALSAFLTSKGHKIGVGAVKGHLQNHVAAG